MSIEVEFTSADNIAASAYIAHRMMLFWLWDLTTAYPNVASKIEVTIRRADPKRDYYYEAEFADTAIVVTLRWRDVKKVCDFLSCNSAFPPYERCTYGDATPRIFPSGDETTVTACEPACFMGRNAHTSAGEFANPKTRYDSSAFRVMRKDGSWYTVGGDHDERSSARSSSDEIEKKTTNKNLPDMFALHVSSNGVCEIDNTEMMTFVTLPRFRSATHDVCRQDNFAIGDDLVYTDIGRSGRHSRTYCDAFYKNFVPETRSCEETWLDRILSYTFLGNALVRLARHAVDGTRCDGVFPASTSRREIVPDEVARYKIDRKAWYEDVDRSWRLPPPNVLLSDLGIDEDGKEWSNVSGLKNAAGSTNVLPHDFLAAFDGRLTARRFLQKQSHHRSRRHVVDDKKNESDDIDLERDNGNEQKITDESHILEYDKIYENVASSSSRLQSDIINDLIEKIVIEIGAVGGSIAIESVCRKIIREAFDRSLRLVGQRLAGKTSRLLLASGLRVGTTRVVSLVMSRLTSKLLLAAASAASGIGVIITMVEILSAILDVMLLVGWDPGKYNSEFDNSFYDDFARGWAEYRSRHDVPQADPYTIIAWYTRFFDVETGESEKRSDRVDDSKMPFPVNNSRFIVKSTNDIPWFFQGFDEAMRDMIADFADNDETTKTSQFIGGRRILRETSDIFTRARPISVDSPALANMFWSMQYFRARKYTSYGQRVDHEKSSTVSVDDAMIESNIRENSAAALLRTRNGVERRKLANKKLFEGAAARNLFEKCSSVLLRAVTWSFFLTLAIVLTLFTTNYFILMLIFVIACLLWITVTCCIEYFRTDVLLRYEAFETANSSMRGWVDNIQTLVTSIVTTTNNNFVLDRFWSVMLRNIQHELRVLWAV